MRITFLGHAGLFVETRHGSVLCDPWFTPAYFGSWFPFPRNDHLDVTRFGSPDYLYLSHLHLDHYDPAFLSRHVDTSATVLLPQFAVPYQEEALRRLGFTRFERPPHGEAVDLDGLEVALFAMNEPADGPLGDSALIVGDGEVRILNQNDARPGDIAALQRLGPYDGHFLQFSGAIWYPVAYDFPPEEKARLGRTKRANQMERARQYVEWIGAAHVFPSAGPPCFLDDDLFAVNDLDDDPANIFPDQPAFLAELARHGITTGHLVVPGSVVELSGAPAGGRAAVARCVVTHPRPEAEALAPFTDKRHYLDQYRSDWEEWLAAERAGWSTRPHDVVAELREWFTPLLDAAPITSAGIGGTVLLVLQDPGRRAHSARWLPQGAGPRGGEGPDYPRAQRARLDLEDAPGVLRVATEAAGNPEGLPL